MCRLTQRKLGRHTLRKSSRRDPQAGQEQGQKPAKVTAILHTQTLTLFANGEQGPIRTECGEDKSMCVAVLFRALQLFFACQH